MLAGYNIETTSTVEKPTISLLNKSISNTEIEHSANIMPKHSANIMPKHSANIMPKHSEEYSANIMPKRGIKRSEDHSENIFIKKESIITSDSSPIEITSNILVKYDPTIKEFKFKYSNNKLIGSFGVYDILKYITQCYDPKGDFLSTDITHKISLIKKFVCEIKYNNKINFAKITLRDYNNSEFMGDIEMLMVLNKDLDYFLKNRLSIELENVDDAYKNDIRDIIDKFNILVIHYTIKLITQIKKNDVDKKLRSELVNYSIGLTYRLANLINNKIVYLEEKQTKLMALINNSIVLKNNLDKRITDLQISE